MEGLFYAGSHGFDIVGPSSSDENKEKSDNKRKSDLLTEDEEDSSNITPDVISGMSVGDSFRPLLERVRSELEHCVKAIPGICQCSFIAISFLVFFSKQLFYLFYFN